MEKNDWRRCNCLYLSGVLNGLLRLFASYGYYIRLAAESVLLMDTIYFIHTAHDIIAYLGDSVEIGRIYYSKFFEEWRGHMIIEGCDTRYACEHIHDFKTAIKRAYKGYKIESIYMAQLSRTLSEHCY